MRKGSIRGRDAGGRSVPVFDEWRKRVWGGTLARVLCEGVYGFVAELTDEVRLHICEAPRREEGVKHALQL